MADHDLQGMINRVKQGSLSRRGFIRAHGGRRPDRAAGEPVARHGRRGHGGARPRFDYKPTKRGGGGTLKLLWWQGPTLLNPHFAVGTKDQDGSYLFYEPLAVWDADANLVPVLAAEVPSRENGGLSADGKTVTWKLKQGVKWHDGKPFTADDCVFNWKFASDPQTAAVTSGVYSDLKVEKVDDHTIRVVFDKPTPFWADRLRRLLRDDHPEACLRTVYRRQVAQRAGQPAPGRHRRRTSSASSSPGALVTGDLNPDYHQPNRPYFDAVEMKGGGEAVSAARAVLQTGEYDFAWNLQVKDEILKQMEKGGKGHITLFGRLQHRARPAEQHRPQQGGGRRALQHQDQASHADRSGGPQGTVAADGQGFGAEIHLRPHRQGHRQLHQRPVAVRVEEHALGIQHQEGERDPGQGRLQARVRRHSRQERPQAGLRVTRPRSTSRGRRTRRSSSRPARRPASISEIKAVLASVFFSSDVGNPNTYTEVLRRPADVHDHRRPSRIRASGCGTSCPPRWRRRRTSGRAATSRAGRTRNTTRPGSEPENELDPVKRAAAADQVQRHGRGLTTSSSSR